MPPRKTGSLHAASALRSDREQRKMQQPRRNRARSGRNLHCRSAECSATLPRSMLLHNEKAQLAPYCNMAACNDISQLRFFHSHQESIAHATDHRAVMLRLEPIVANRRKSATLSSGNARSPAALFDRGRHHGFLVLFLFSFSVWPCHGATTPTEVALNAADACKLNRIYCGNAAAAAVG